MLSAAKLQVEYLNSSLKLLYSRCSQAIPAASAAKAAITIV